MGFLQLTNLHSMLSVALLRLSTRDRAGRLSPMVRWEWCNSVRCASANAPCVQECNSISVQFRATKPGDPSSSGAVRTGPEEYSVRQPAALWQFSAERVRLSTLCERVLAHLRGTGESTDTVWRVQCPQWVLGRPCVPLRHVVARAVS